MFGPLMPRTARLLSQRPVAHVTILEMARPFHVEVVPPLPLTVEETAEKYGVSRTKSKLLKEFATGVVTAKASSQVRQRMGHAAGGSKSRVVLLRTGDARFKRNAKRVGRAVARKSAKSSRVASGKKK